MSEVVISKEPLKKVAMVDIPPKWIASFFDMEDIVKKYGSLESFMFQEALGYKNDLKPTKQLFMYDKKDLI